MLRLCKTCKEDTNIVQIIGARYPQNGQSMSQSWLGYPPKLLKIDVQNFISWSKSTGVMIFWGWMGKYLDYHILQAWSWWCVPWYEDCTENIIKYHVSCLHLAPRIVQCFTCGLCLREQESPEFYLVPESRRKLSLEFFSKSQSLYGGDRRVTAHTERSEFFQVPGHI